MTLEFKRDYWIKSKNKNIEICCNPTMPNFILFKQGFYKHIMGCNHKAQILEEISHFKPLLSNKKKIKTLVIAPNKQSSIQFKKDIKESPFSDDFDFTFKHNIQITKQNKENNPIENEFYDLAFIYEGITIKWILKKNIKLNANFFVYFHLEALSENTYQYLLTELKSQSKKDSE